MTCFRGQLCKSSRLSAQKEFKQNHNLSSTIATAGGGGWGAFSVIKYASRGFQACCGKNGQIQNGNLFQVLKRKEMYQKKLFFD